MRQATLVRGNALEPASDDLIVLIDTLDVGKPVPDGWKVTSGNIHNSEIVWIGMRYQIEVEGVQEDA